MTRHRWSGVPLAALLVLAACGSQPAPSATPPASDAPPAEGSAAPSVHPHVADLDELVTALERHHPEPWGADGEAAFRERVAELRERAPELDVAAFGAELMRLLGDRDLDGHTGVFPFIQGDWLEVWPLHLFVFADGIRVVAARDAHEDAIGMRVVAVGGVPVAEAWERLVPFASRDNAATLLTRVTELLLLPAVLSAAGLDPAAGLELADEAGRTRTIHPEPVGADAHFAWLTSFYPHFPICLPPHAAGPAWLRNRDRAFWFEPMPEANAVYVGYHQVVSSAGDDSLFGLVRDVEAAADPGTRIVVDVRNNGGGDNTTFAPLAGMLERRAEAAPGSVVVLFGRCTFSAAANFVTRLARAPGVILAGEPLGGGLNNYGDTLSAELDHTGILALIATSDVQYAPGDERLTIRPTVRAELTWADYAAGRDPALEAALAARPGAATGTPAGRSPP